MARYFVAWRAEYYDIARSTFMYRGHSRNVDLDMTTQLDPASMITVNAISRKDAFRKASAWVMAQGFYRDWVKLFDQGGIISDVRFTTRLIDEKDVPPGPILPVRVTFMAGGIFPQVRTGKPRRQTARDRVNAYLDSLAKKQRSKG